MSRYIPSDYADHSQAPTDSYIHLSTDHGQEYTDDSLTFGDTSIHNDTSLLMDLVAAIDQPLVLRSLSLEEKFLKIKPNNDNKENLNATTATNNVKENNTGIHASPVFPSHSTPLANLRHSSTPKHKVKLDKVNEVRHQSEAEQLFKLYQPQVNEELKYYIRNLINQKKSISEVQQNIISQTPSRSGSDGEDEVDDILNTSDKARYQNDLTKNQNINFPSPDTTPPHSQEYTEGGDKNTLQPKNIEPELTNSSGNESDYDRSYVPKSVISKMNTPDPEIESEENNLRLQIEILKKKSEELESQRNNEVEVLREELRRMTEDKEKQYQKLENENLKLKIEMGKLEVRLLKEENNEDHFQTNINDEEEMSPGVKAKVDILQAKLNLLTDQNMKLNKKLMNSKDLNKELQNELEFAKISREKVNERIEKRVGIDVESFHPIITQHDGKDLNKNGNKINDNDDDLRLLIKEFEIQIGNKNDLITKDTVLSVFKNHYIKYKLDEVDNLSKVELINLVKNIMLSLLCGELSELPLSINKIANIMKLATKFMDDIHGCIYQDNNGNRPSTYVKAPHNEEDIHRLHSCVSTMVAKIKENYAT